jgi:transcriptional regulator with XRE-family HTH domain
MSEERSANAVDRRLGQRLRTRRLETGLSQERLAEILGVTFQQVQKYEKGVNRMAASRLFEISAALEVPVAYFFEGLTAGRPRGMAEEPETAFVYDILATPEGLNLLQLFSSIKSAKLRRRVVDLVRAMVEDEGEATKPSR